jgi:hypothetical protein
MKQLGLSFLLIIFLLTSCNPIEKLKEAVAEISGCSPIKISFEGIQSFKESEQHRDALLKEINESDQDEDCKGENKSTLDSLYWEHVADLLSSGRTVILDSETRASEKLRKILELKANYQTLKFIVKSQNDEQTISKLLNQIEADIVSLKHLQVWDNRIQTLEEEIKKFGNTFPGPFGSNQLDQKIIVIDSLESNELGDVKQIIYTVKYTKIYEGTGNIFKYQVEGQGDWKVSLRTNQSILTIENLCPQCYTERRIN